MQAKSVSLDRKLMREVNQNSLLNLIRAHAPVARQTLAALSGLSSATVLAITNNLMNEGIVQESGLAESSTRGPKPTLLEIRADGRYAVGIKVTENETISVILNLNGDIVYSEQLSITPQYTQPLLVLLTQGIKGLIERSNLPRQKIIGVGCALPGLIDSAKGYCIRSWHLGLDNFAISDPLAAELKLPVYIDNDANCLAAYEKLFGQLQFQQDFVVVSLGSGVGAGMIVNGDLYHGAMGTAGEVGHMVIVENGRPCLCGKRGCLEAYVSDYGIVASYLQASESASVDASQAISFTTVMKLAKAGEPAAIRAFTQAGYYLGIGLSHLIHLFNPASILLTGPNIAARTLFSPALEESLSQCTLAPLGDAPQIVSEPLEYADWARGAASLALRQFYLPPAVMQEFRFR